MGLDQTPVIGDIKALAYDAPREFRAGRPGWGALALASAIPGVPAIRRAVDAADDLPMDEASRMARAREMGFDVDTPLYHGSPDFRAVEDAGGFTPRTRKHRDNTTDGYIDIPHPTYLSDSRRTAASYADDRRAWDYQNAEPRVIEAVANTGNFLDVNARGRKFSKLPIDDVRGQLPPERHAAFDAAVAAYGDPTTSGTLRTGDLEAIAHAMGYDGFRLRHVVDNYDGTGPSSSVVAVFDPSRIRYPSARFDPAKSDSPDLMAGIAAALGTGALLRANNRDER